MRSSRFTRRCDRRCLWVEQLENRFLLSAVGFASGADPAMLFATTVPVTLALTPPGDVNRLDLTMSAEAFGISRSDSDSANVTGNMVVELDVDFDELTHEVGGVNQFEFTGGRLNLSDVSFSLNFGFLGTVAASGSGISGMLDTPVPPGTVSGGEFNTAEHLMILDNGQFHAEGSGLLGGLFAPITINLADVPIEATTDMTGYLDVSLQSADGETVTHNVVLTLPVDFNEVVYEAEGILVNMAAVGTLQATGQFTRAIPQPATVESRHLFYNNCYFDGNDPAPIAADDAAIAPGKQALLPGEAATFANYTSYDKGINGMMIDIDNLPDDVILTAADFEFRVGNDSETNDWTTTSDPTSVTVRPGEGVGDSDRVTLIWDDGAIVNQWLMVIVLPTLNTGLAAPDVFYFGNAPGESGNSATDAKVNAIDMLMARNNPRNYQNPATINSPYDFNRDQRVNALDMLLVRNHQTHFLNALELISVPESTTPAAAAPAESALVEDESDSLGWLQEFDPQDDNEPDDNEPDDKDQANQAIDELMETY